MLQQFASAEIFGFLLVFARLGTMMMTLPGFGESVVPTRVRLAIGLSVTLALYMPLRGSLPGVPDSPIMLALMLGLEIAVGLLIGVSTRLVLSGLHVAGTVIAFQSGLAAAQNFDPTQNSQGALLGAFMTLMGLVTIFAFNLHYLMLAAMRDSYQLFPIGQALPIGDFSAIATRAVADSFALGIQIAAPFMVYGLVFNIGLGLLARLMPQLQVFFIAMPLNVLMAFIILMLVLGAMMAWFTEYFQNSLGAYIL